MSYKLALQINPTKIYSFSKVFIPLTIIRFCHIALNINVLHWDIVRSTDTK